MLIDIILQQASDFAPIPNESDFTLWATAALKDRSVRDVEICIRLVDKDESKDLNIRYRKKDGPTNVLSFPNDLPNEMGVSMLGDLVICAPLVAEEAQAQNKTAEQHWAHLTIHGILHLIGYDHETEKEAELMENLEIAILAQLNYPNPY